MSRDDAPNFRIHDGCFYCFYHKRDGGQNNNERCIKHDFIFDEGDRLLEQFLGGETNIRVCDDYKKWDSEHEPR